jgi:hypothetical protein
MATFRALFSGLCAYLPDVDLEDQDPNKNPSKMLVLMPDVMDVSSRGALDGRKLRAHFPVLQFKVDDLVDRGGIPPNIELEWSLVRKEISFILKETVSGSNPFSVVQRLRTKMPPPTDANRDFNHGVHIREIWEDSKTFQLRSECFLDGGSSGILAARCRLSQGSLSTWMLDERIDFAFTEILGGSFDPRPLSNRVALEFVSTSKVTLVIRDLDNPADISLLDFKTDGQNDVEVFIGNICCDPRALDEASSSPLSLPDRIGRDKDFRAYFDLFESNGRQAIIGALLGAALPMPVPNSVVGGAGLKPVQCMRLDLNAQNF